MKERPILMSAPMVRAILDGTKTQTRRIADTLDYGWIFTGEYGRITSPHPRKDRFGAFIHKPDEKFPQNDILPCRYGEPGDRLWVKETFGIDPNRELAGEPLAAASVVYRASWPQDYVTHGAYDEPSEPSEGEFHWGWRPSIFMPRKWSRITLKIVSVRVERLNDISEGDALAEGVEIITSVDHGSTNPVAAYQRLWGSINGPGSWALNPWVWAIEFRRVKP